MLQNDLFMFSRCNIVNVTYPKHISPFSKSRTEIFQFTDHPMTSRAAKVKNMNQDLQTALANAGEVLVKEIQKECENRVLDSIKEQYSELQKMNSGLMEAILQQNDKFRLLGEQYQTALLEIKKNHADAISFQESILDKVAKLQNTNIQNYNNVVKEDTNRMGPKTAGLQRRQSSPLISLRRPLASERRVSSPISILGKIDSIPNLTFQDNADLPNFPAATKKTLQQSFNQAKNLQLQRKKELGYLPGAIPLMEKERLAQLERYQILDSANDEHRFNNIVRIASKVCRCEISLISFVAENRQWFKARVGLDACTTSRDTSFCAHAVANREIMDMLSVEDAAKLISDPGVKVEDAKYLFVVEDASKDPRFQNNPLVNGPPNIRFYAGAVVMGSNNLPMGTVCVISSKPRVLDEVERDLLLTLARQVRFELDIKVAVEDIREQKSIVEKLLNNILPTNIIEQLRDRVRSGESGNATIAQKFDDVTIMFLDIVGFTKISSTMPPETLVEILGEIFHILDDLALEYGLCKIKTIGDGYMLCGGVPVSQPGHSFRVAAMALATVKKLAEFNANRKTSYSIRIGINRGPVVAGVISSSVFSYDIWGDAVNVASRMESNGEPGKIACSQSMYDALQGDFEFSPPKEVAIKGKGNMNMYFLLRDK